jgi:hypothetical protein
LPQATESLTDAVTLPAISVVVCVALTGKLASHLDALACQKYKPQAKGVNPRI